MMAFTAISESLVRRTCLLKRTATNPSLHILSGTLNAAGQAGYRDNKVLEPRSGGQSGNEDVDG